MSKAFKNTKKQGNFRLVIFPAKVGDCKYTAACIDFAIVREGDDVFKLRQEILNASVHYLLNVQKNNLSDKLLNQTLPKKYTDAYNKTRKIKNNLPKLIKSPIPISDLQPWESKSHATA